MVKHTKIQKREKPEPMHVCQNCRKDFSETELEEITHGFWERVSPGETMPSGECPDCGALCHPVEQSKGPILITVRDGIAKAAESTVPSGIRIEVIDYDAIEEFGRRAFNRLSKTARTFALRDQPTVLKRFKGRK